MSTPPAGLSQLSGGHLEPAAVDVLIARDGRSWLQPDFSKR